MRRRAAAAGLAGLLALACPAAAAAAPAIISATVYGGPGGRAEQRSTTLSGCPTFAGPATMYAYPGSLAQTFPADSTWSLATVLTCGLQLPLSAVGEVQVVNPARGLEPAIAAGSLSEPGAWHDPQAPGALPVVSQNGSGGELTYFRPWLGGSDENARDEVQSDTPIALAVYQAGTVLTVVPSHRILASGRASVKVSLAAAVRTAAGAPLSAAALSWSWSFGDGGASARVGPSHTYVPGVYDVTVQAVDNRTGVAGTATFTLSVRAGRGTGGPAQSGGGRHGTAPSGPVNSAGGTPGGRPGSSRQPPSPAGAAASRSAPANAAGRRSVARTGSVAAKPAPAPAARRQASAARGRRPAEHRRRPAVEHVRRGTRVVTGRLVSDVIPLPAGASPLRTAAATSPALRSAGSGNAVAPILGSVLAVGLLLALGAGRELHGRRAWRRLAARA